MTISINEFLKEVKDLFGNIEYKATSKDGKVYKSKGFDYANNTKKRKSTKPDIADW